MLAGVPGVVGDGAPCHVPARSERAQTNVALKKIE